MRKPWCETAQDEDGKRFTEGHWRFARHDIQHIAWKALVVGTPRLEVHARPLRPAQAKPEWEARE